MIYFITSNKEKIDHASPYLKKNNIDFIIKDLPITEIQSDSTEEIIMNKAEQAFTLLGKPLIITDHHWSIPGLNGFPGPYMKYMNQWLTSENFLDLTKNLDDRRAILTQVVCYKDKSTHRIFKQKLIGELLPEIKGLPFNYPAMTVISHIKGMSNAEARERNIQNFDTTQLWKEFAEWYHSTVK